MSWSDDGSYRRGRWILISKTAPEQYLSSIAGEICRLGPAVVTILEKARLVHDPLRSVITRRKGRNESVRMLP